MPSSIERLGQVLKQYRERLGLSQELLAAHSGLNRTFIGEIERGETNPSFETLVILASTLQVPLSEVISVYERMERG
ncbi:helix-turn-helix domain-containing protein [Corallococcus exiguus]|uniref:helix-turn-helix domain-containing protein n=1 Tax=Corallococcus exiguus TaxID=83462 RepID=UPI001560B4A5|nr:helix-turn-helix transcriptional regulator [Corallococcus exiguus]NRD50857.1 helix-turn-helix transcriptional regulator [Corallococcus exiguus]